MNFTPHKYLLKSKHAFWNGVPLVSIVTQEDGNFPKFLFYFLKDGVILIFMLVL